MYINFQSFIVILSYHLLMKLRSNSKPKAKRVKFTIDDSDIEETPPSVKWFSLETIPLVKSSPPLPLPKFVNSTFPNTPIPNSSSNILSIQLSPADRTRSKSVHLRSPIAPDAISSKHTLSFLASIAAAALSPLNKVKQVSPNTDKVEEIFHQAALFYTTENISKEVHTVNRIAFIEQAKTLLKEFDHYKRVYEEVAATINKPIIDSSAASLLVCEEMFHNWQPIQVHGDGNCLFNAVALYLTGKHNAELLRELRLAVACELLFRGDLYCKYL